MKTLDEENSRIKRLTYLSNILNDAIDCKGVGHVLDDMFVLSSKTIKVK